MKQTLFVTATDTGVGKTLICGLLLRFLRDKGVAAGYQKWVSTGGNPPMDLEQVAALAGADFVPGSLDLSVPYRFAFPASPHLAAELEGRRVEPETVMHAMRKAQGNCDCLIVEGVGGIMVPLNREVLLVDLLARCRLPTLVVARSGLGTLNHTLLTIEALRRRQIPILGLVLTDSAPVEEQRIASDNRRTLEEFGQVEVLGRLPWCTERAALHAHFVSMGERIFSLLQPG